MSESPNTGPTEKAGLWGALERGPVARLRGWFIAGVLVLAPIGITVAAALWLIDLFDNQIIPEQYNPNQFLPYSVPGIGILLVVSAITLAGWLTSSFIGRTVQEFGEQILDRIPIVRGIYGATKQIVQAVLAQRSTAFRQVALFEYPRKGIWSIGFLTGSTSGEVESRTQEETVNVFLPTTPNPTSGYLLFVPKKDLVVLDMTVEDGIKMVVSGGIVTPPWEESSSVQGERRAPSVERGTGDRDRKNESAAGE